MPWPLANVDLHAHGCVSAARTFYVTSGRGESGSLDAIDSVGDQQGPFTPGKEKLLIHNRN
jgi:hypothetical protein